MTNAFRTGGDDGARNLIGIVTEVAPDFNKFDPAGFVWGRPGHYPLWVVLGHPRWQSAEGKEGNIVLPSRLSALADGIRLAALGKGARHRLAVSSCRACGLVLRRLPRLRITEIGQRC